MRSAPIAFDPEHLRHVLESAETPLNSAKLSKLLQQKSGKALKPILDSEVKAGRIYGWAADLYWHRNPLAMARERLLCLTKSEVLAGDQLAKRAAAEAPTIGLVLVRTVHKGLLKEGVLREVNPPPGSKGKTKLIVNAEHPELYLEREIGRLLMEFGIDRSRERIRSLLEEALPQPAPRHELDDREVANLIYTAMNRIAFAPGTSVTFYRLRQQPELADIPKSLFDKGALLLQQERRAFLLAHGHALSLAKTEQDELVTDGLGAYYVSICAL
jgi:hypothetical protein